MKTQSRQVIRRELFKLCFEKCPYHSGHKHPEEYRRARRASARAFSIGKWRAMGREAI